MKQEVILKITRMVDKYSIPKQRRFIKFGQAYSNICSLADKNAIDLIVIGSHGKNGIRSLLGSTATGVLNHANCDLQWIKRDRWKILAGKKLWTLRYKRPP